MAHRIYDRHGRILLYGDPPTEKDLVVEAHDVRGCDLSEKDVSGVDFREKLVSDMLLKKTDARETDWRGLDLESIDFTSTRLAGAKFDGGHFVAAGQYNILFQAGKFFICCMWHDRDWVENARLEEIDALYTPIDPNSTQLWLNYREQILRLPDG